METIKSSETVLISQKILIAATVAVAAATVFLAYATFRYLNVAQESLKFEKSPQVFLASDITSKPLLDHDNKRILVTPIIRIKNGGRGKANNIRISFVLKTSQETVEDTLKLFPYLFPDQTASFPLGRFAFPLSEQTYQALKEMPEKKFPEVIPEDYEESLQLEFTIFSESENGALEPIHYKAKYTLHSNEWTLAPTI